MARCKLLTIGKFNLKIKITIFKFNRTKYLKNVNLWAAITERLENADLKYLKHALRSKVGNMEENIELKQLL